MADVPWPDSVGLVGTGRVASALGRAARAADLNVAWVTGRNPSGAGALGNLLGCPAVPLDRRPPAGLVIVAVSDDALDAVAAELAATASGPGTIVHTCGARGRDALAPLAEAGWTTGSWHPLQAFATPETRLLRGVSFGITAEPALAARLDALSVRLEGRPLHLDEADHARYHAAAAMAANYTAVVLDRAALLLDACGLDRSAALAALLPLVRSSLHGVEQFGMPAGLTGPAVRGDAGTIRRHLDAIADAPGTAALYRACGTAALPILAERGLGPDAVARVRDALE